MMKTKNLIIIAIVSVVLSGCKSLYGTYERPKLTADGLANEVEAGVEATELDTISYGNLAWKTIFTDPILQNLIDTALVKNVDMLNSALNVQMVEAQLKAAKLAFLPQFAFSPQGTISSWDGGDAVKTYSLPISASWNIDLFGNLLSQKRAAQMALLATKDYQLAVKTNVICAVANMYYTLLMLDKQAEIIDGMSELTNKTLEFMKMQMELGRARSTSIQSTQASIYKIEAQRVDVKRQIREVENALSLLIGQSPQEIKRGSLDNQSLSTDFSNGISISKLANRPDVHYAEMNLAKCFYNTQTARARFYPNLTISANGAFTNSAGMGITNPGKWLLSAVGSLVQPIFMKGQLIAGLKVAQAQQEQAYNTWQNSLLKASAEVSNAMIKYNSAHEKSALEELQIEVLKTNVEHTQMLFASSGGSYLEIISAQQNLLNAQLSKIADDFTKMQAVISLYQALGGGVK